MARSQARVSEWAAEADGVWREVCTALLHCTYAGGPETVRAKQIRGKIPEKKEKILSTTREKTICPLSLPAARLAFFFLPHPQPGNTTASPPTSPIPVPFLGVSLFLRV